MAEEREMTLVEHLQELRDRLVKSAIGMVVATLLSLLFTSRFLKLLILPAGGIKPVFLTPTEGFLTYMKVALLSGVGLAMPVIVYQILRFVTPGLQVNERRYLFIGLPAAALSFLAGAAFAYLIMLPAALGYLAHFGSDIAEARWAIGEYISFVTTLMFWVGVVFEAPLLMYFLARLHIVNVHMLTSKWQYAVVIIAVLAAVITPTADPFNMMLLMAPLLMLYVISIGVARLAGG